MLRRVLGTPTPPPPPDAGSLPADDKLFGGMTVFERLEAHKRNRDLRELPRSHRSAGISA